MKGSISEGREINGFNGEIDWELRPGGMLVQKRNVGDLSYGLLLIKIKVSYGSYRYDVTIPAQSTFGELKRILWEETGLEPKEQRLLFKGKEKENEECLHMAGVNDMSKVILLEDPASRERKQLEDMKKNQSKPYEAVAEVRKETDSLSEKVTALERTVCGANTAVGQKEFDVLTELLMVQLLKLDAIEANGDAKVQRRNEVHRVQKFVDSVDNLKARNLAAISSNRNGVTVSTKWETFETGVGSLHAPASKHSSAKTTHGWELFE